MKKLRIISLVLVILIYLPVLASCHKAERIAYASESIIRAGDSEDSYC